MKDKDNDIRKRLLNIIKIGFSDSILGRKTSHQISSILISICMNCVNRNYNLEGCIFKA